MLQEVLPPASLGGPLPSQGHPTEGLWSHGPTEDWEGLVGVGQEDGRQLQLAPRLEEGIQEGPAFQLSNA